MAQSIPRQQRVIGAVMCPSPLERVWQLLEADGQILIQPMIGGDIFSDVRCK